MERYALNKLVRHLSELGLFPFAIWVVLNIAVTALIVAARPGTLGKHGIMAIMLVDAVIVLLARPYWSQWLPPERSPGDDE